MYSFHYNQFKTRNLHVCYWWLILDIIDQQSFFLLNVLFLALFFILLSNSDIGKFYVQYFHLFRGGDIISKASNLIFNNHHKNFPSILAHRIWALIRQCGFQSNRNRMEHMRILEDLYRLDFCCLFYGSSLHQVVCRCFSKTMVHLKEFTD